MRATISLLPFFFFAFFTVLESSGDCSDFDHAQMATPLGGIHDSPSSENSLEIESLARFAVDQHNTKQVPFIIFFLICQKKKSICCYYVIKDRSLVGSTEFSYYWCAYITINQTHNKVLSVIILRPLFG